jgi:hypothetical protein
MICQKRPVTKTVATCANTACRSTQRDIQEAESYGKLVAYEIYQAAKDGGYA